MSGGLLAWLINGNQYFDVLDLEGRFTVYYI